MSNKRTHICAVPNCGNKSFPLFRFPRQEDRCRKWVEAVGDEDLFFIPIDLLYKLRRVCSTHIKGDEMMKGPKITRLVAGAVPNLMLWNPSAVVESIISMEGRSDDLISAPIVTIAPIDIIHKEVPSVGNSVGSGMVNVNNTCYLNSILQALFHIGPFTKWLMHHEMHCEEESGNCICCDLGTTFKASKSKEIIVPELIIRRIKTICPLFTLGAQEDAHEFLTNLLSKIGESLKGKITQECSNTSCIGSNPITEMCGGELRSEVTCQNCGHVSTTYQEFQDLCLSIREVTTVDGAFGLFFNNKTIDYKCERCDKVCPATNQFSIERPPKVLCVQLKRFTVAGDKISKELGINLHENVKPYLSDASRCLSQYRLIAMVSHRGISSRTGHYTAIAETPISGFRLFDDAVVRDVPFSSITDDNGVYIIFYELEVLRSPQHDADGGRTLDHCIVTHPVQQAVAEGIAEPSQRIQDQQSGGEITSSKPLRVVTRSNDLRKSIGVQHCTKA